MFGNLKELPKPIGKYTVGITQMDFIDKSRKKVFEFEEDNALREIPVTIYYPAESTEDKETAPYASPEEFEIISKNIFGLLSKKKASKVKTHCYENVSIAISEHKFPVIMYNHGYTSYTMQDTTLCSNLASSGYVVVSLGHPYESGGIKYLDGRVVYMHKDNLNNLKSMPKEYRDLFKKIIKTKETYSDEKAMATADVIYKHAQGLSNNVKIWVADSVFIADQLEALNDGEIESIFKDKLKLELGIGITGHSYGGTTAAQTCLNDDRFTCGINIDGGTYGDYLHKDIKKPFMVIGSTMMENISRTTFIYNTEDTYMALLSDTAHFGYSDVLFIARQLNLMNMIGKREKFEFHEIYTTYVMKFFEKYLLGNKEIELKDIKYNGVIFLEKRKAEHVHVN